MGRLIDWKHPEHAILVAERLKKAGRSFTLNLIGSGDMEHVLRRMITEKELDDCVHLLGSMPPEQVRLHMERAGIFLFTSSRKEGWGAVLNEAMNSGCAVVASRAAGAVPYLVQDGVNGVSYTFGDIDRLSEQVDAFLADPEKQRTVGMRAFETVVALWNADVAAERFLSLVQHIQNGEAYPTVCESGPCSKA